MHLGDAGTAPATPEPSDKAKACRACLTSFTPTRAWAAFCRSKCRNDFHAKEARVAAIREAAPAMYAALAEIAQQVDGEQGLAYGRIATEAIKDLKAP